MTGVDGESPLLTILSVAFPYAVIGPHAVGGAEVICTEVEAALGGMGFRSVIVARAGSSVKGVLYPTEVPEGTITDEVRAAVEWSQQQAIDRACREQPVGLVHMHGLDFARYRLPEGVPVLVTLHLPPEWYPEAIWDLPERYTFVCVSESQRQRCPAASRGRVRVVPNGVPLPEAATLRGAGRYALMLARICPEKNLHAGLDAARMVEMPVVLGGETFAYKAHQRYFAEEIAPRLTASGQEHEARGGSGAEARFAGAVSGAEKARLLRRAACLLLPSLAPETSSLVAMEAMAAGVPVVGMRVGAVPEIVEDGRTGLLVTPGPRAVTELADALRRVSTLSRAACRAEAEERFSLPRMLAAYEDLYRALPGPKVDGQQFAPETLLVKALKTETDLEALRSEWEELWTADRTATPFQHPAWLLPWWRQFGPDGELQAVVARGKVSGRLLGLLPSYLYRAPGEPEATLLVAGAGTSDYLGGVFAGEDVAEAAVSFALSSLAEGMAVHWPQLQDGNPLLRAGEAVGMATGAAEPCSLVATDAPLPGKLALNLGRSRRLAEAEGTVRCELAATTDAALEDFDHLVAFHTARWQARGEGGVLGDSRVLAHHRESVPLLLAAGLLHMFRLTIAGQVAGVLYAMADGLQRPQRRFYLYLIGFAPEFAAVSPGGLLVRAAFEQARREGAVALDLLRGGEAYKRHWGAAGAPTFVLHSKKGAS